MKTTLDELQGILTKMEELSKQMAREERVLTAERQDRIDKGITDEKAVIQHFNEWMQRAGLSNLIIKDNE